MRLFSYGTLMLGEVMELVAGRSFKSCPGMLAGFQRRRLRGEVYPAIVPAAAARALGVLWQDLDRAALARIDRFEGALYERQQQPVQVADGEFRSAFVYVLRPEQHGLLLESDWDEAEFRAAHLCAYLATCRAFSREQGGASGAPRA